MGGMTSTISGSAFLLVVSSLIGGGFLTSGVLLFGAPALNSPYFSLWTLCSV